MACSTKIGFSFAQKKRLIELFYDCVLFDGGIKKLPRVRQYFGLKAAQDHVKRRQGGVIWHTQGAGKSILMVMLAKWILENYPHARVYVYDFAGFAYARLVTSPKATERATDSWLKAQNCAFSHHFLMTTSFKFCKE